MWTVPTGWTITSGQGTTTLVVTAGNSSQSGNVLVQDVSSCGTSSPSSLPVTINASVSPSISITASPAGSICAGTSVTFTASITNGGSSPSYQWKINGTNVVGANSPTYTNAALANGAIITCVLTSNATCASPTTATSNGITMTVNPNVTPSITIAASPTGTICSGTSVTFTATPTNGGTTPFYQWKKNGLNVGTNSFTYTDNSLANKILLLLFLHPMHLVFPRQLRPAAVSQ